MIRFCEKHSNPLSQYSKHEQREQLYDCKLLKLNEIQNGEGGIRTHVPPNGGNLISSQARYNHFGTSPQTGKCGMQGLYNIGGNFKKMARRLAQEEEMGGLNLEVIDAGVPIFIIAFPLATSFIANNLGSCKSASLRFR